MVSRHTLIQAVSRLLGAMFLLSGLTSCGTVYDLYAPPGATIHSSLPGNYENPDKYRVPESERKIYLATKTFTPPKPRYQTLTLQFMRLVDVEAGDIWTVTHRIQGRLVIFSEQYQARQKRTFGGSSYLFSLFIDENGRVNRGWLLLRDPRLVVLASERMTIMDPSVSETDGWPDEPVFVEKK